MKKLLLTFLLPLAALAAEDAKRDPSVVKKYIRACVGDETLKTIQKHEGGKAFLSKFFTDTDWMEQFAGSGMWEIKPWKGLKDNTECAAKALQALDLLVWNDKDDFIDTKIGRNIATALALNHGIDWTDEKLVMVMECYREWAKNGTLVSDAWKHDVRQWREVLGFGQNADLSVENLRWIHDFANVDHPRYYDVCWQCTYRLFNCFGASVHTWMYYAPWEHRWNTQELRYRVGGVCGALSKFGSHCAAAHGIRSFTAGQPAHCAYLLWDYSVDRWGISYAVTAHTMPHNSLGGPGFAAVEEQNRYYSDPKRMKAEFFRWKGDYAKAMKQCPGNYHAAVNWYEELESKKASKEEWDRFADAVCATFNGFPSQGWVLIHGYLSHVDGREAKLAAVKKALLAIRESSEKTFENPYWDEIALEPIEKLFGTDEEALWGVFQAALDGQAKTTSFYRQTIAWGAKRLMTSSAASTRFLKVVGESALKSGEQLDFKSMVLKASQSQDIAMFKQVYALMDKLSPDASPKPGDKKWPLEMAGGKLLSPDGLLMTSSTSSWDQPTNYRNALDARDYKDGNAFHTDKDKSPWATVVLPGASDLTAIVAVNAGTNGNQNRQIPLRMWVSEDGKDWREVYQSETAEEEWVCTFPTPVKAKFVKVGRPPEAKQEFFHLHKILVYGKKLY